uniref:Uncharacterized protein n=1 Tax=Perkinsus chesapeaki TaxID=330153 RepID=A7YXP8_PERCH|nr:unknown [Perkinsus chesapeaki]ABY27176.1 unknown protein [Perkinsus chesapeaki]ABY27177.1 unknown protein [Perkinsus chesapeaki]
MRCTILSLTILALSEVVSGTDCPTGDAQCAAEQVGSYCKAYGGQTEGVCQYTDTPCSCVTTAPPTPTGGGCASGDAYCQKQTGDMGSYCKAAYKPGAGGVCQGSDEPCTCSGTTSSPTGAPTTSAPTSE